MKNARRKLVVAVIVFFFLVSIVLPAETDKTAVIPSELAQRCAEYQESMPPYAMHTETQMMYSGKKTLYIYDQRWDGERIDLEYKQYAVTGKQKHLEYKKRGIWTGKQFQWRQQYIPPGQKELDPVQASGSIYEDRGKRLMTSAYTGAFLSGILLGDKKKVGRILAESNDLTMSKQMESVSGNACYVIEGKTPSGHYKLWIDPAHGFNVRKAVVVKKTGDLYFGEPIGTGTPEEHKFVGCQVELNNVKIEEIAGHYVSVSGALTHTLKYSDGTTKQNNYTSERSNVQFNPDFEAMGAFVMDGIPDGTRIKMEGVMGLQYIWSDAGFIVDAGLDVIDQIDHTIDALDQKEVTEQEQPVQTDDSDENAVQTVTAYKPDTNVAVEKNDITGVIAEGQSSLLWIVCTVIAMIMLIICVGFVIRLRSARRSS